MTKTAIFNVKDKGGFEWGSEGDCGVIAVGNIGEDGDLGVEVDFTLTGKGQIAHLLATIMVIANRTDHLEVEEGIRLYIKRIKEEREND